MHRSVTIELYTGYNEHVRGTYHFIIHSFFKLATDTVTCSTLSRNFNRDIVIRYSNLALLARLKSNFLGSLSGLVDNKLRNNLFFMGSGNERLSACRILFLR